MVLVARGGASPPTRPSSSASHDARASSVALSSMVCPAASTQARAQPGQRVMAIWYGGCRAAGSVAAVPARLAAHSASMTSLSVSGWPHAVSRRARAATYAPSAAPVSRNRRSCRRAAGSGGASGESPSRRPRTMSSTSRTRARAVAASQSSSVAVVATRVSSRAALYGISPAVIAARSFGSPTSASATRIRSRTTPGV